MTVTLAAAVASQSASQRSASADYGTFSVPTLKYAADGPTSSDYSAASRVPLPPSASASVHSADSIYRGSAESLGSDSSPPSSVDPDPEVVGCWSHFRALVGRLKFWT